MQNIVVFFMHNFFSCDFEVKYILFIDLDNRDIEIHTYIFSVKFVFVFNINNERYYINISQANNEKGFKCKTFLNIFVITLNIVVKSNVFH